MTDSSEAQRDWWREGAAGAAAMAEPTAEELARIDVMLGEDATGDEEGLCPACGQPLLRGETHCPACRIVRPYVARGTYTTRTAAGETGEKED